MTRTERTPRLLAARAKELGIPADSGEADFAPDSPRGNAICRMVDADEIAYVTSVPGLGQSLGDPGELIVATVAASVSTQ